jgi:hypothetical protein
MSQTPTYEIVLLPRMEVAERRLTLAEARAWMHAYNDVMDGRPYRAVIGEEFSSPAAAA